MSGVQTQKDHGVFSFELANVKYATLYFYNILKILDGDCDA